MGAFWFIRNFKDGKSCHLKFLIPLRTLHNASPVLVPGRTHGSLAWRWLILPASGGEEDTSKTRLLESFRISLSSSHSFPPFSNPILCPSNQRYECFNKCIISYHILRYPAALPCNHSVLAPAKFPHFGAPFHGFSGFVAGACFRQRALSRISPKALDTAKPRLRREQGWLKAKA